MSKARIRAAFESRLTTWAAAQSPEIQIAWENIKFTPPEGRYGRANLIPARTASRDLGGMAREYVGVFQVSLYMPIGVGPGAADSLEASLDGAFPVDEPLGDAQFQIFITSPMSAAPALEDADRYVIPVSCMYRAGEYLD